MMIYVVAEEYWHPNSSLYEGAVRNAFTTRKAAEEYAASLTPADATGSRVYEVWLEGLERIV